MFPETQPRCGNACPAVGSFRVTRIGNVLSAAGGIAVLAIVMESAQSHENFPGGINAK